MREIFITPQFEEDIKVIPSETKARADEIIIRLRENPSDYSLGARKLKGMRTSVFRVRIGSYRLVYRFTSARLILLRIKDRKDIYRSIKK